MSGHNSRSGLFLMEMIIVILFFSICAAICVSAFAKARVTADSSRALNDAVIQASNTAEAYKASGGDLRKTAELLSSAADGSMISAEAETIGTEEKLTVSYKDMTVVLEKKDDGLADVTAYGPGSAGASAKETIFTMHARV